MHISAMEYEAREGKLKTDIALYLIAWYHASFLPVAALMI